MTTDLWMLTASASLCALLFIPYGIAQTLVWGVPVSVGFVTRPRRCQPGRSVGFAPIATCSRIFRTLQRL